ncbi:MAG: ABC transporter substrate-binding protein [Actinomycetota bacterium]
MVGKHRALWRLLAVLLAFSLIAAACGGDDDDAADDGTTEATDDSDSSSSDDGASNDDDGAAASDDDGAAASDDDGAIQTEEEESTEEAVEGGTLRFGLQADSDGINPVTSSFSVVGLSMANAVFDTYAAYDEEGNAVPYLAESFEPSEDLRSWTMRLRPGATGQGIEFHDGTFLNAEAVRVNFETVLADPLVGIAVQPFYPSLEDGAFEIIDDLTVRFNLLDAHARFPALVTGQLGMAASPAWIAAALEDPTLNQQPVGTGPFVFDSRSQDSVTRFVRNENWWNGRANLDAIEFVPVTDPDVRVQLLLEGELDVLNTTNTPSIEVLAETDGVQNLLDDTGEESFIMINSASPPFDDIRARQALTFATPRETYNTLFGLGINRLANQQYTPESRFYNPDVVQEADMPELAGPLVEAHCAEFPDNCTDGRIDMELQYSGPSVVQTRIAELFDEAWSPFFNVEFQELPEDQHINETVFGTYDVVTWRQFGAVDPAGDNVWLLCRTVGPLSLNFPRLCDEERDELLIEAWATEDEDARAGLYQELQVKLNQDYVYIFLQHSLWDIALNENVKSLCDRTSPEGVPLRCAINGRTFYDSVFLTDS